MSLILGAMAGAGEGLGRWAEQGIKHDQDVDLENLRNENAYNKTVALEQWKRQASLEDMPKIAQANLDAQTSAQMQTAQRVKDATGGLVNDAILAKINRKYSADGGKPLASIADATAQELSSFAVSDKERDELRSRAIKDLGLISPEKEMADTTKGEIAAAKNAAYLEKLQYLTDKAGQDNNTKLMIAAMRAAAKGGSGGAEGDGEPAKVKAARAYLAEANKTRADQGLEPMTFTEAFSIANYAPRADAAETLRGRVALNLIRDDPKMLEDPDKLNSSIDNFIAASGLKQKVEPARRVAPSPLLLADGMKDSFNAGLADTPFGALGKVSSSAPTAPASFKSLWRQ